MEIERKFLVNVDMMPSGVLASEGYEILAGYLNPHDKYNVRFRYLKSKSDPEDKRYFLEIKSQGNLKREEYMFEIDKKRFWTMIRKCPKIIAKTRYVYKDEETGYTYDVDFYEHYKFVTAEVEFRTEKEAKAFKPPKWFKKDVTNKSKYKNVNLAESR